MSLYDLMEESHRETGLPPTGLHRGLANHVVQRFAVTCESCNGTGSQYVFGERLNCRECRGWRKHLSPAAIRRLHQIVTAVFPEIRAGCTTELTAQRWAVRKYVPATRPMYLGVGLLPASVPPEPADTALAVCSLTWRRGLRSELLWSGGKTGPCVLWEQLPDLRHPDGAPWTEVFAWTPAGTDNAGRSALRLLERGWSDENRAYDWLAAPKRISRLGEQRAFAVTSVGIVSEQQIEWVFLAAARARSLWARHAATVANTEWSTADSTQNIGPYPFNPWSTNRKAAEARDTHGAIIPRGVPADRVTPAEVFAFRREQRRRSETADGDAK
jgi:hypothetical protein